MLASEEAITYHGLQWSEIFLIWVVFHVQTGMKVVIGERRNNKQAVGEQCRLGKKRDFWDFFPVASQGLFLPSCHELSVPTSKKL